MHNPAPVDHPIHPLLARRWSPRAFAPRRVEGPVLRALFEAARWAPSCYNEQPWRFLVARADDGAAFERLLDCLVPGNRAWAQGAPVLILGVVDARFARDGSPNAHAWHDLGLAAMSLVVEATAQGLLAHQMAGIDRARIVEAYELPEGFEPVSAIALGYPAPPEGLGEDDRQRAQAPRARRTQREFVFAGEWGRPAALD